MIIFIFSANVLDYVLHIGDYLKDAGPYIPLVVGIIVFVESGILLGFFLPGDSLLLSAGVIAAEGSTSLSILLIVTLVAAIAGDQFGYFWGQFFGERIVEKKKLKFIKRKHLDNAHAFFEKNGGKSIILARFVPIIRTFVPFTAGVVKMKYRSFVSYNIIGGTLWGVGVTLLGFLVGKTFGDKTEKYLLLIIAVVILISFIPVGVEVYKAKKNKKNEKVS